MEDSETAIKTWAAQKVNTRRDRLKTHMAINNNLYNAIAEEEEEDQIMKTNAVKQENSCS